ncbi:MAG: M23 family metallopeptidase [Bacilli bacterium]|nr:M23 family metallopeptidase [Bacilli bacterium]
MKEWIKKINENKFQFFFFVGVIAFLFVSLIVVGIVGDNQVDTPDDNTPVLPDEPDDEQPTNTETVEKVALPFDVNMEYEVVRKFYDRNGTKEDQEKALIKYGSSYRTSVGTSYAKKDDSAFDVLASLSGTVLEVKENPLYGNYVVIEHKDNLKTCYYGLSEVTVTVGSTVNQGDKIGVSGTTEIDADAGNHVYFQVLKNNKHVNPENLIDKKTTDL